MKQVTDSHPQLPILFALLALFVVSLPAFAVDFAGGMGEPNDPYQIATPEQLIGMGEDPNLYNKCFIMVNDIDLSGRVFEKAVIAPGRIRGAEDYEFLGNPFIGSFNGNGYYIFGLTIQGPNADYIVRSLWREEVFNEMIPGPKAIGLFGCLGSQGVICNLNLNAFTISGTLSYSGGLAAYNDGGKVTNCSSSCRVNGDLCVGRLVGLNYGPITNCKAMGQVNGSSVVGGLVGKNYGSITNSRSTGQVSGLFAVGGVAGSNHGYIVNCNSTSQVSVDTNRGRREGNNMGGLVGSNNGGVICNCSATGQVTSNGEYVGGLVGENKGRISNSYSTCQVSSSDNFVGGLVGGNQRSIVNSHGTGQVNSSGHSVGGLVGVNDSGRIVNCYSLGTVNGTSDIGGLVGDNGNGTINSCYSAGTVKGVSDIGGLVGDNNQGSISNSFWDTQTSGLDESDGGTGLNTTQMKDINTYLKAGWDFVNESANGIYQYWRQSSQDYPTLNLAVSGVAPEPNGIGTPESPYIIADAYDLGMVWQRPWATYQMKNNINLSEFQWNKSVTSWFNGTIDGNNHSITGVSTRKHGPQRLIGTLGSDGFITKLGLEAVDVNGTGIMVGYNHGSISYSYITGTVRGGNYVGAMVVNNFGSISHCFSTCHVSGDWNVGGLVALNSEGTISHCYSTGTVSGIYNVGGLIGGAEKGNISHCYSAGKVRSSGNHAGGLMGSNVEGSISDCYSTSQVNSGGNYIGGLMGYNWEGPITNCYSTGTVKGGYDVGGLVGGNSQGLVSNSFWDIETSGLTESAGGNGITTDQMQNINTYMDADWDFVDTWMMREGDYPHLQWEQVQRDGGTVNRCDRLTV